MLCLNRCHFVRVLVKKASVAANHSRPVQAFYVMTALPAPPAPVPDKAVEEPAGAVEAAPPPVVEPEVFYAFLLFQSAEPCEPLVSLPRVYVFPILQNVALRFACWLPHVYLGVIFPYASVFTAL